METKKPQVALIQTADRLFGAGDQRGLLRDICFDLTLAALRMALQADTRRTCQGTTSSPNQTHSPLPKENPTHRKTGEFMNGVEKYDALLTEQTRNLGSDHPDTLATRNNLAATRKKAQ